MSDQESQSTQNEISTLSKQEEFRKSIISDVLISIKSSFPAMLGQIRPQTNNFGKYSLVGGDGVPEDSSSVTNSVPKDLPSENNKYDNFSDLFPALFPEMISLGCD